MGDVNCDWFTVCDINHEWLVYAGSTVGDQQYMTNSNEQFTAYD